MNRTSKRSPGRWATNGFVLLTALVFLFPLYWMIVLSTHAESNVYRFPPPVWPGDEVFRSFQRLLEKIPYFLSLWNSVYVAVLNTFLVLFVSSFAGYGFARYRNAPGNRALFLLVVASLMIPPLAGIIPWFVMMDWLGWINTHWPLIIPPAANAFGVFWMYQFTREAVPEEIYESAKIDGASDWRVYWQIVIPLIRPGLGALSVFAFLQSWQNFQMPLIVLNDAERFTLPLALANLSTLHGTDIPAVMLGTTISILPIFVAFLLGTRHFISGLTSGAVKS